MSYDIERKVISERTSPEVRECGELICPAEKQQIWLDEFGEVSITNQRGGGKLTFIHLSKEELAVLRAIVPREADPTHTTPNPPR